MINIFGGLKPNLQKTDNTVVHISPSTLGILKIYGPLRNGIGAGCIWMICSSNKISMEKWVVFNPFVTCTDILVFSSAWDQSVEVGDINNRPTVNMGEK